MFSSAKQTLQHLPIHMLLRSHFPLCGPARVCSSQIDWAAPQQPLFIIVVAFRNTVTRRSSKRRNANPHSIWFWFQMQRWIRKRRQAKRRTLCGAHAVSPQEIRRNADPWKRRQPPISSPITPKVKIKCTISLLKVNYHLFTNPYSLNGCATLGCLP